MGELLGIGQCSRFFSTISDLKERGGYPRSALALIVAKCEDYRRPWRHEYLTASDIALKAKRETVIVAVMLGRLTHPDKRAGSIRLYAKARLPELLELLDGHRRMHPDFMSVKELSLVLGVKETTAMRYVREEILIPDRVNAAGVTQFRRSRLPEIEKLWKKRRELYPAWAPVKGVITPYGMMRPRAAPRGEVFAPEMLLRPARRMRGSYSPRETFYNLTDLNTSPSEQPSKTIFVSTSLKSVRTRVGSKSRRRIS